jgi:hypothetical protein
MLAGAFLISWSMQSFWLAAAYPEFKDQHGVRGLVKLLVGMALLLSPFVFWAVKKIRRR